MIKLTEINDLLAEINKQFSIVINALFNLNTADSRVLLEKVMSLQSNKYFITANSSENTLETTWRLLIKLKDELEQCFIEYEALKLAVSFGGMSLKHK